MTLDKAIETLTGLLISSRCRWEPDNLDAIKLGKEALKRVLTSRLLLSYPPADLLPGETPE